MSACEDAVERSAVTILSPLVAAVLMRILSDIVLGVEAYVSNLLSPKLKSRATILALTRSGLRVQTTIESMILVPGGTSHSRMSVLTLKFSRDFNSSRSAAVFSSDVISSDSTVMMLIPFISFSTSPWTISMRLISMSSNSSSSSTGI